MFRILRTRLTKLVKLSLFLGSYVIFLGRYLLWANKYSVIKKSRLLPISLTVSLSLLDGNSNTKLLMAKCIQLVFTIDDLIDENNVDPSVIKGIFKIGDIPDMDHHVAQIRSIYNTVNKDIQAVCQSPEAISTWQNSLSEFVGNITIESNTQFTINSEREYLNIAKITSGIYFYMSCLSCINPDLHALFKEESSIVDKAALLVRLSNDLRSFKREEDSNSTNLIKFYLSKGLTLEDALLNTTSLMKENLALFEAAIKQYPDRRANGLRAYITFIVDMYRFRDFHQGKLTLLLKLWARNAYAHL
jgi:hypothetical protein